MFEGLVVGLLNQYLGEFIENVSSEDLRAKVWSGEVILKKLKVKTKALDFLQLPINVVSGYIGKILLKADWAHLGSKPVVVNVEDVYVVARPRSDFSAEEKLAMESAINAKLRKLASWQKIKLVAPEVAANAGGASWTEKLTTKIVNNLQISLRRVHIRYEDPTLVSKPKFACCLGVCLGEINVNTTDELWKEKFVNDVKAEVLYKKLDMKQLAIYLNTNSEQLNEAQHLSSYFRENSNYHHLVPPLGGFVKLTMQTDTSPGLKIPKNKVECGFEGALGIKLSEYQYRCLLGMLSVINRVQGKLSRVLEGINFEAGTPQDKEAYVTLYKRTLNATWLPELTTEEKGKFDQLERRLTFECLARYRNEAIAKLRHQLKDGEVVMTREEWKKQNEKDNSISSSVAYYLGWGKSSKKAEGPKVTESELESKTEEIYRQMDYNPEDDLKVEEQKKMRPKDYITMQVSFQMPELFFELLSKSRDSLLKLVAANTEMNATSYVGGLVAAVQMKSFQANDYFTKDTLYKNIIFQEDAKGAGSSTSPSSSETRQALLRLEVELPPLDKSADTKVSLNLAESTIVVNPMILTRLSIFFTPPQDTSDSLELISGWSARQAKYLSDATTASLSQSLETHSSLWVSLDVKAPTLIIPADLRTHNSMVLVLDFGQFKLETDLQSEEAISSIVRKVEEEGYAFKGGEGEENQLLLTKGEEERGGGETRGAVTSPEGGEEKKQQKYLSAEEAYQCYDCYTITGAKFEVYLTNGGPRWRQNRVADLVEEERAFEDIKATASVLKKDRIVEMKMNSPSTLISPFDLNIKIYKTIAPGVVTLPRMKIEGDLPTVSLSISPSKYKKIMQISQAMSDNSAKVMRSAPKPRTKNKNSNTAAEGKTSSSSTSTLTQDTTGLRGNILDAKENQTFADLKHALGDLPETDAEAKALLDKAKEMKGGVPPNVIQEWWKKRMLRLQTITSLLLTFKIGNVRLILAQDGAQQHVPTKGLAVATFSDFMLGMRSRYFDSKTVVALSEVCLEDLENPFGEGCARFLSAVSQESADSKSFVRVEMTSVLPDSPEYGKLPCPSITAVSVGDTHVTLEPTRFAALMQFVLYELLNSGGSGAGKDEKKKQGKIGSSRNNQEEAESGAQRLRTFLPSVEVSGNINAQEEKGLYYLRKKFNLRMNLRSEATVDAEHKTGVLIEPGAVFKAVERLEDEKTGQVYLKIQDDDDEFVGWAFMRHPRTKEFLIVPFAETKVNREASTTQILRANFGELCIHMMWKGKPVAKAAIKEVQTVVTQYRFSQTVNLTLGELKIQDCTPEGVVYPNAVETLALPSTSPSASSSSSSGAATGNREITVPTTTAATTRPSNNDHPCLVCVEYKTYDPHERKFPGYCSEVSGSFRGLRIIYTARFLDEIVSMLTSPVFKSAFKPPPTTTTSRQQQIRRGGGGGQQLPPFDQQSLITAADDEKSTTTDGMISREMSLDDTQSLASSFTANDRRMLTRGMREANTSDEREGEMGAAASAAGDHRYEDPAKGYMKISLKLSDVELWVPESSKAKEKLSARIDSIEISNKILSTSKEQLRPKFGSQSSFYNFTQSRNFQRYSVRLSRFSISSQISPAGCNNNNNNNLATSNYLMQLGPVEVNADSISDELGYIAGNWIDLGEIKLRLNQNEYQMIMRLLSANLAETKSIVSLDDDDDEEEEGAGEEGPLLAMSTSIALHEEAIETRSSRLLIEEDGTNSVFSDNVSMRTASASTRHATPSSHRTKQRQQQQQEQQPKKKSAMLLDVRLKKISADLAWFRQNKESPLMGLGIEDLAVNYQKVSYGDNSASDIYASCKNVCLDDHTEGKEKESPAVGGKRMMKAFKSILSVEEPSSSSLAALPLEEGKKREEDDNRGRSSYPFSISVKQAGGIQTTADMLQKRIPVIRPDIGTQVMVNANNLQLILQEVLLDLASFFTLPGEVIIDGWMQQKGRMRNVRRFMSLEKVGTSSSDAGNNSKSNTKFLLHYAVDSGGIKLGAYDLSLVNVTKEEDTSIVITYRDNENNSAYTYELPSNADRDMWFDALDNSIELLQQEGQGGAAKGDSEESARGGGADIGAAAGKPSTTPPMAIRASLVNPCVILPRDPYAQKTEGLILSWNLDAEYRSLGGKGGGTILKASLENTKISRANFDASQTLCWAMHQHQQQQQQGAAGIGEGGRASSRNSSGIRVHAEPLIAPFDMWFEKYSFASPLKGLLKDVSIHLDNNSVDVLSNGTAGKMRLGSVVAKLRYNDYKLVMHVIKDVTDKLSGGKSMDAPGLHTNELSLPRTTSEGEADSKLSEHLGEEDGDDESKDDDIATTIKNQQAETNHYEQSPSPPPRPVAAVLPEQTWDIELKRVSVTLINDKAKFDVPIARVSLDEMRLSTRAVSHGMRAFIKLRIMADYHNNKKSSWEPMLEPWNMVVRYLALKDPIVPLHYRFAPEGSMRYDDQVEYPVEDRSYLHVSSDKDLNLNLTAGMVMSVQQSVALLTNTTEEDDEKEGGGEDGGAATAAVEAAVTSSSNEDGAEQKQLRLQNIHEDPYSFVNETEFPISFTMNGAEKTRRLVPPGASVPFSFQTSNPTSYYDSQKAALLLVVGEVPFDKNETKALTQCNGFEEFYRLAELQSYSVRMSILGSFPPRMVLKEKTRRFLKIFYNSERLVTTDVATERHHPQWLNILFDCRKVQKGNGEYIIIQCADADNDVAYTVRFPYAELFSSSSSIEKKKKSFPLKDDKGRETGAYLKFLRVRDAKVHTAGESKVLLDEDSWICLPAYDFSGETPVLKRPDLAGNVKAMIHVSKQIGSVAFSMAGAFYAKATFKSLRHFDAPGRASDMGLYISVQAPIVRSHLISYFKDTPTSVFPLSAVASASSVGHVAIRMHVPARESGVTKRSQEWKMTTTAGGVGGNEGKDREGAVLLNHVQPFYDFIAQGDKIVSVKTDLVAKDKQLASSRRFQTAGQQLLPSILYTTKFTNGLKRITVHSDTKFVNNTALSLELSIRCNGRPLLASRYPYQQNGNRGNHDGSRVAVSTPQYDEEVWARIEPGKEVFLPTMLTSDGKTLSQKRQVHIRPAAAAGGGGGGLGGRSAFQWSKPLELNGEGQSREYQQPESFMSSTKTVNRLDPFISRKNFLLACKPRAKQEPSTIYFNSKIERSSGGSISSSIIGGMVSTVRFLPAVVVKNLLPDAFGLQWGQRTVPSRQRVEVLPGAEVSLFKMDPSEQCSIRIDVPSIGRNPSRAMNLPPLEHFLRRQEGGEGAEGRWAGQVTLLDDRNRKLNVCLEVKATALKVLICVSAPYWIFDTTGLNLGISEDKKTLCPQRKRLMRYLAKDAKKLVAEGEKIEHAQLFSFQTQSRQQNMFVSANPEPPSGGEAGRRNSGSTKRLPRCPTCVSEGPVLDRIARKLKKNRAYTFQRGERILYHYGRGLSKIESCVILTSKAVTSISKNRITKSIALKHILRASYSRSGLFASDAINIALKNGQRDSIEIWEAEGAQFFVAMINYISSKSLQENNITIMRSDWCKKPISANNVGTEGHVSLLALHSTMKSRYKAQYEVGYQITSGAGAWRQTIIINFVPRYFIMNNTKHWIEVMQEGVTGEEAVTIKPEGSVPFHWPSQYNAKNIRFRCVSPPADGAGTSVSRSGLASEEGWNWSSHFPISKPADHKMRIRNTRDPSMAKMARVEIRSGGATLFVVVSFIAPNSDDVLPYRVENRCTRDAFHVRQVLLSGDSSSSHGSSSSSTGELSFQGYQLSGWLNVQPHTHVPFAADDVTKKAVYMVAVDEAHSDSEVADRKKKGNRAVIIDLSSKDNGDHKKRRDRTILMQSRWDKNFEYMLYVFMVYDGPVKVIVISEEPSSAAESAINPFDLRPLLGNELKQLNHTITRIYDSVRENKRHLDMLESNLARTMTAAAAAATPQQQQQQPRQSLVARRTRSRPNGIPLSKSALQVNVLRVLGIKGRSPLYCLIEFGDKVLKLPLNSARAVNVVAFDLAHARGGTELRISLMQPKPLWTDECLGMVEVRLDDFASHLPVTRRFPLKPCRKQQVPSSLVPRSSPLSPSSSSSWPRWKTPPCSRSSKVPVSGELYLDIWWIPAQKGTLSTRIDAAKARIEHRKRVLRLLEPTQDISRRYDACYRQHKNKLMSKHMSEKEARQEALQLVNTSNARFTIRLLDVQGKALARYGLKDRQSKLKLSCIITVNATGQSVCSTICENGHVALGEWFDSLTFDLPRGFLAKAAAGDQRGRAKITIFLQIPTTAAEAEEGGADEAGGGGRVGYRIKILGEASIPLADVQPNEYGRVKTSLATADEFSKAYAYDAYSGGRHQHSWGKSTNYHWVRVQANTSEEVSLLVFCKRMQGALLPERSVASVAVAVPRVGLSVVDQKPRELFYLSISDTLLRYRDCKTETTNELSIGRIQVDNQMLGYSYPFILCPKPVPLKDTKEMLQVSVNRSKDNPGASRLTMPMGSENCFEVVSHRVKGGAGNAVVKELLNPQYYAENHLSQNNLVLPVVDFLLQEFELNLEENLYYELLTFIEEFSKNIKEMVQPSYTTYEEMYNLPPTDSQIVTIGLLKLQSVVVKFSFEMSPGVRKKGLLLDLPFDPTAILISIFGSTLGSIEDMKLVFESILMQNVHTSTASLSSSLLRRYKTDLLIQWYKVVFGLQIIGNPVGALENMADGVKSFFLEPTKGMVEDPGVFGFSRGVAKGSRALLESTISSAFGAAGMVTGSLSKGAALLSMDDEFIQQNKQSQKAKPKHIGEGLLSGAKSVGMGVFGGISGVFLDPIKGAKKEGFGGFFKGTAKGLLGVVAKPTAGVINATSQTLKSVGNTATLVLSEGIEATEKVRPPRYVPTHSRILPSFDFNYSLGAYLLQKKKIKDDLVGFMLTNQSDDQTTMRAKGTYSFPRVVPMDKKSPQKKKREIKDRRFAMHAVMITDKKLLVEHCVKGNTWKTVADIKLDRIKSDAIIAGSTKDKRWGVQISQAHKPHPTAIWCSGKEEAESLKQTLKLHIN